MKTRTIKTIVFASQLDMSGMPVKQAFPSRKLEAPDPFLLLHYADVKVPTHVPTNKAGVGPHPHRGFSPVTFIFKGGVHHRDSRGNNNVIYEGGTQWMNAGMGIIHSERPPVDIHENGGRQEIIQLWVNTPAAHKLDIPAYYPLTKEETPFVQSEDGLVSINVHSGKLDGISGKIPTWSEVNTYTVSMKKTGRYFFKIPDTHNAFIYVLDGNLRVDEEAEVSGGYTVLFNQDGEGIELTALEDTRLFIGTGKPLSEPIASHGPFVMNTQSEIMEAFRDYEMGKMGVLIED